MLRGEISAPHPPPSRDRQRQTARASAPRGSGARAYGAVEDAPAPMEETYYDAPGVGDRDWDDDIPTRPAAAVSGECVCVCVCV